MSGGIRKNLVGFSNNGSTHGLANHSKRQLDFHKGSKTTKNHRDYSLPPIPDEDDDLLSHYASPKCIYEPLPVDLFPLPETFKNEERLNAARFPCFRYYDLTKYSTEEAQQLSAMDLIPKDALKKTDTQHMQRAKRSKRITTEATHLAGYYRNKNEGVEVLYGGKDGANGGRLGAKTRRAQQLATQSLAATNNENQTSASASSQSLDPSAPVPKKQGNRMEFLAGLRRQLLPSDKKSAQLGGVSKPENNRRIPARGGGLTARRMGRSREYQDEEMEVDEEDEEEDEDDFDDDHASVHSTASSASTGGSVGAMPEKKTQMNDRPTVGQTWLNEDSTRGRDRESNVALAFIANEELGDSDDEGARF